MVPARGYFDLADLVVTYEGPFADYARAARAGARLAARRPADRTAHLVYAASLDAGALAVRLHRRADVHLYVTSGTPPEPVGRRRRRTCARKPNEGARHAHDPSDSFLALLALGGAPAAASAQAPPGLPGPPPGNGTDLPAPPGTAPAFVAPGTAATIPAGPTGPGLLKGGDVALNRAKRTFSLPFACQANGTLSVTAKAARRGTLARTGYRCAGGRATARLSSPRRSRRKVVQAQDGGRDRDGPPGRAHAAAVVLADRRARRGARPRASGPTATCSAADGRPYLAQPDFTTKSTTPISTRGWVAWYTAAGGWHWLGVNGEDKRALGHLDGDRLPASPSSTPAARSSRSRSPGARSRSRPARGSTPSASTRSSTGSAAGRTTSGSTSTRARRARRRPARATPYCAFA